MGFSIEAFQNRYLAADADRADAILSVTAANTGTDAEARDLVMGVVVHASGSMKGERIKAVKAATEQAIGLLDERVTFFVVEFKETAGIVCPPARATERDKIVAAERLELLLAGGGTAMSQGLATARMLFRQTPDAIHQALFLTDGKNESEDPSDVAAELQRCAGLFECDCWGVGTDWQVGEVQEIARALMGKPSLIPDAGGIEAAFRAAVAKAQAKAIKDVRLRLWTPQSAQIVFVKQVNPTIEDLTARATELSP